MAERDFDDIAVSDIAAKAGLAKGSVLAHFGEKSALATYLLAERMDALVAALFALPISNAAYAELGAELGEFLDFLIADDIYALLICGGGAKCHAIIAPHETALMAVLTKLVGDGADGLKARSIRAALIYSVVSYRASNDRADAHKQLTDLTLFALRQ